MSDDKQPIIIKKKKGHGHGHHGGAWKIAYADFVTAMMAFFLLMWLLNATSEEQKRGIADYFSPVSVFEQKGYSGGAMGSQMATIEGAFDGRGPSERALTPVPGSVGPEKRDEPGADEKTGENEEKSDEDNDKDITADQKPSDKNGKSDISEENALEAFQKMEQEQFAKAEEDIKQAILEDETLEGMINHLMIEKTEDGLRIQLLDQDGKAMFPSGGAKMHDHTLKLLEKIANIVVKLDKKIYISGHTDSSQYKSTTYSNWELSTDRANASRRALVDKGVPSNLIESVVGKADREHLDPANPESPRNRRISITLLKSKFESSSLNSDVIPIQEADPVNKPITQPKPSSPTPAEPIKQEDTHEEQEINQESNKQTPSIIDLESQPETIPEQETPSETKNNPVEEEIEEDEVEIIDIPFSL